MRSHTLSLIFNSVIDQKRSMRRMGERMGELIPESLPFFAEELCPFQVTLLVMSTTLPAVRDDLYTAHRGRGSFGWNFRHPFFSVEMEPILAFVEY